MECINLNKNTIKILGIHYSYDKILENEKNFKKHILNIEGILKIWRLRNLTLENKIIVFEKLALSKITHLALVKTIPKSTIEQLNMIQKGFIWNSMKPKIKHSTLCNNYQDGGLKNVNIESKIISLQCSWIKQLYDKNMHNWKIIPLALIEKFLGKGFKFHSNMKIENKYIRNFRKYY